MTPRLPVALALATIALIRPALAQDRRLEDEVVYVVILEKFADGNPANNVMKRRYQNQRDRLQGGLWGGDLDGAIAHLDDLQALGVTALLIYPVMQNDQAAVGKFLTTGYRPKDYEHVDENFGDIATLRRLVDGAHARGMRVILDLPLALPGFEHPYVTDPTKKDWLGAQTRYGLKRWNVANPEVADFLIGVAKRWKERSGCDGFRLDSAHLHPRAFWKRFATELKAAPPAGEFLLIGELALPPKEIGEFVQEVGFDSAYDFSLDAVESVFGRSEDVGKLAFVTGQAEKFYRPSAKTMVAQVDRYEDIPFVESAREPKIARTKLAFTLLLTIDRVPLLYPGDELGIAFREVGGAFLPSRNESPFLKEMKALIALRKNEPALRRGAFAEVRARDGIYAFTRTEKGNPFLIVLNGSTEPRAFEEAIGDRAWKSCRLVAMPEGQEAKAAGIADPVAIPPLVGRIFKIQ